MFDDPFEELRRDVVALVKQDGQKVDGIKAKVERNKITFAAFDRVVDDGDTLIRHLPDGRTEQYLVLDSGYKPEFHGIPAKYECGVEKKTALKPSSQPAGVVYNVTVSGVNSRFNLHSLDLSTNLTDVEPEQLFKELRTVLARDIEDDEKRTELLKQVGELKKANGTPRFLEAYQGFVSSAADHMGLVTPFIPALTQLLSGGNG